jgi:acetyltransferase-like isoleucine patch superfamily enzyme
MNVLLYLQRLVPIVGLVWNRMRFPGLWTGLRVEISGTRNLTYGKRVRIGEGTRIDLACRSRLIIGDDVVTGRGAYLSAGTGGQQTIGDRTSIQDGCRIYGSVAIGRGCIFAHNVYASAGTHTFDSVPHLPILEQECVAATPEQAIRVLDDCWIGANVVIMPGVTIARGCVVGANAVVTTDLEPYSVVAGAPARLVRKRLDFAPPPRIDASREQDLPYFYDGFEFATRSCDDLGCDGNFSLALRHPGARVLRLCLSGDGVEIWLGDQCRAVPKASTVIEFSVQADGDVSPLFKLRAQGRPRIHWAELV